MPVFARINNAASASYGFTRRNFLPFKGINLLIPKKLRTLNDTVTNLFCNKILKHFFATSDSLAVSFFDLPAIMAYCL